MSGTTVVATAEAEGDVILLIERHVPDILIMIVDALPCAGFDILLRVKSMRPQTKIMAICGVELPPSLEQLLRAGTDCFVHLRSARSRPEVPHEIKAE